MNEPQQPSFNGNDVNVNTNNNNNNNRQFICGVVEGFYGKPWTFCQRKDLFKRLKEFNLNAFMYAPKDDTKHRAKWRQLYNEVEANELKTLIDEATANGIDFYYSLAPGLDMIYSSQEEHELLCRKYDQLKFLGCKSYAILFDDIEPNFTNEKDRVIFKDNYAQAQVSITNLIHDHLGRPKFLFCPTEYCESRAVPTVPNSVYLNTIGTGLHNDIDIMWSGPRVVSRFITEESIKQLNSVLRRPAVIWENLHANDYDKKRVYLGPYSGRSTKIISQLRGVLTNPNCEYEANYVAIHTLAQWSKSTKDINPLNRCNQERPPSQSDEDQPSGAPSANPQQDKHTRRASADEDSVYDPDRALVRAIRDWLPHVLSQRSLPHGCNISTLSHTRNDQTASDQLSKDEQKASSLQVNPEGFSENDSKPMEAADMLDQKSPATSTASKSSDIDMSSSPKPMTPTVNIDSNSCDSCEMRDASEPPPPPPPAPVNSARCAICMGGAGDSSQPPSQSSEQQQALASSHKVDLDSLALLVDFFYLPFEHGIRGHAFLKDISWLIDNSSIFEPIGEDEDSQRSATLESDTAKTDDVMDDEETSGRRTASPTTARADSKLVELWAERAEKLHNFCTCVQRILDTLIHDCPNKLIMVELFPYLMELRDVIIMIMDYIKFLRDRKSSMDRFYYSGQPKRKEFALSDEQEPWVHRGGLIGDVQRLIS